MNSNDDQTAQKAAPPPRRRRRTARGILWVIATALALSGLLRLSGESGVAIAEGIAAAVEGAPPAEDPDGAPSNDIAQVLSALQDRETTLAAREVALADRQKALEVVEAQVRKNLVALEAAEASLEATMTMASTAAEDDLARLTAVYENMKAKEAAPLFAAMDPQFAAGFLARMRPDTAAAILAGLDPSSAYSISVILAGRNAEVPTR
ncbi:MotE family protein [Maritimibacter sp. HL-12]|uniref:MotE family protein n=1 Tax=Maritimibacter sp. HL-12 TaxID=1162418 RepID=UPI000A0F06EB|nr:hypothetical protein [Maritimibacter sp. HL-12]SMH43028.1 Flagellar motility protein MotE, a chaperone for MotC folding [Maritimibacter sp. HL-12]